MNEKLFLESMANMPVELAAHLPEIEREVLHEVLNGKTATQYLEEIALEVSRLNQQNTERKFTDEEIKLIQDISVLGFLQGYVEAKKEAKKLVDKAKLNVPPAHDLFQGKDITPIPNNPYSHFVVEAIAKGGTLARYITDGWRENTIDGQPQLLKQAAPWRGGSMVAKFDPVEQQAVNAAELWARVEGLNPLTADVALAILGTLGDPRQGEKPKFPMLEPVVITTERILQYKGIQKWGSDRRVLQQRIAAEFKTLQDLTVEVRSIPFGKEKKGKELLVSIPRCKLFDVAEVYEDQYCLNGLVDKIPIGWAIRAGMWANYWFNSHGRMWLSGMSRVLLELDHRTVRGADVVAKKIGLLLLAVPGGTAHWNAPITRGVERLLADIGELPEPDHRGKDWANRTRERLDTALAMLKECGALMEYRPSDDYPDPGDRGKGWVERWLSASITLTAPEFVTLESDKEQQQAVIPPSWQRKRPRLGKPRKALEPGQSLDETTVNRIRQTAAARNLLLKALAEQLGVARSTLSNVLARREAPSAALAAKIRAFLDSPEPD